MRRYSASQDRKADEVRETYLYTFYQTAESYFLKERSMNERRVEKVLRDVGYDLIENHTPSDEIADLWLPIKWQNDVRNYLLDAFVDNEDAFYNYYFGK